MKRILVLDNYDSFTYNLVHMLRKLEGIDLLDIFRNDQILLNDVEAYTHVLLSPGPGLPADAGIMPALIQRYAPTKSILGVCLGHQAIAEAFGGQLSNLAQVFHGVATPIATLGEDILFQHIPPCFTVCRYHSWVVNKHPFPPELSILAVDDSGLVMALRHRIFKTYGVQFHPESILTEHGEQLIKNWLSA